MLHQGSRVSDICRKRRDARSGAEYRTRCTTTSSCNQTIRINAGLSWSHSAAEDRKIRLPAELKTSNSNRWLLAWTLRRDHVDYLLVCRVAWLHKGDIFFGVLRAQRFKHTTSHEASPFRLCFLCHLSAPIHDSSEMCTICPRIAVFAGQTGKYLLTSRLTRTLAPNRLHQSFQILRTDVN